MNKVICPRCQGRAEPTDSRGVKIYHACHLCDGIGIIENDLAKYYINRCPRPKRGYEVLTLREDFHGMKCHQESIHEQHPEREEYVKVIFDDYAFYIRKEHFPGYHPAIIQDLMLISTVVIDIKANKIMKNRLNIESTFDGTLMNKYRINESNEGFV